MPIYIDNPACDLNHNRFCCGEVSLFSKFSINQMLALAQSIPELSDVHMSSVLLDVCRVVTSSHYRCTSVVVL